MHNMTCICADIRGKTSSNASCTAFVIMLSMGLLAIDNPMLKNVTDSALHAMRVVDAALVHMGWKG